MKVWINFDSDHILQVGSLTYKVGRGLIRLPVGTCLKNSKGFYRVGLDGLERIRKRDFRYWKRKTDYLEVPLVSEQVWHICEVYFSTLSSVTTSREEEKDFYNLLKSLLFTAGLWWRVSSDEYASINARVFETMEKNVNGEKRLLTLDLKGEDWIERLFEPLRECEHADLGILIKLTVVLSTMEEEPLQRLTSGEAYFWKLIGELKVIFATLGATFAQRYNRKYVAEIFQSFIT